MRHFLWPDRSVTAMPSGYLFANDFAILDEAHTVEGVASRQTTMELSAPASTACGMAMVTKAVSFGQGAVPLTTY